MFLGSLTSFPVYAGGEWAFVLLSVAGTPKNKIVLVALNFLLNFAEIFKVLALKNPNITNR